MSHDVFISHSHKDKTTADAICHAIEASGIRCWIAPRDELAGIKFIIQIAEAIEKCSVFVLVFTSNSNFSDDVTKEVTTALENSKTVIPFRVEDVPMNQELNFLLKGVHWLDAYPDSQLFDNLVEHVSRNLSRNDKQPLKIADLKHEPTGVNQKEGNTIAFKAEKDHLGADLSDSCFNGHDFRGANLKGCSLSKSSFIAANFSNACLEKTDFSDSNLESANLSSAVLYNARMPWVNLQFAVLVNVRAEWARLTKADMQDARIERANFNMADLREANMQGANAANAVFSNALLNGANLRGADFTGADFENAILDGAKLVGAVFSDTRNLTVDQINKAHYDDTTIFPFELRNKLLEKQGMLSLQVNSQDECTGLLINDSRWKNNSFVVVDMEGNAVLAWEKWTLDEMLRFVPMQHGYYRIESVVSGLCLDVSGGAHANETKAQFYESNGTDAQLWKMLIVDAAHVDGPLFCLEPKCSPGMMLDIGDNPESSLLIQDQSMDERQLFRIWIVTPDDHINRIR